MLKLKEEWVWNNHENSLLVVVTEAAWKRLGVSLTQPAYQDMLGYEKFWEATKKGEQMFKRRGDIIICGVKIDYQDNRWEYRLGYLDCKGFEWSSKAYTPRKFLKL